MMVVLALSVICVATYGIANFQQAKFGEVRPPRGGRPPACVSHRAVTFLLRASRRLPFWSPIAAACSFC
jgi:hypothetical protein